MSCRMNAMSIPHLPIKFMTLTLALLGAVAAQASVVINNTRRR